MGAVKLLLDFHLLLLALSSSALAFRFTDDLFPNGTGVSAADFPDGFLFGAITSAMKHEGAELINGKSLNIWDQFAHKSSATIDGSIPGQCGDNYHRYAADHALLVNLGMNAYRLSLAWSRIYPNGSGELNELAISHYNKVIDDALGQGLTLFVTLWTQDHPYQIEQSYGSVLNATFINDFANYANACFNAFGDRIKYWITLDEPNDWAGLGYASNQNPPGRCTSGVRGYGYCDQGNSSTEPYIAGRNLLLAHAAAVAIYRDTYQDAQNGSIGIALWTRWFEPLSQSEDDVAAAERALDFLLGWFLHPILIGDYPDTMKTLVGSRLPAFSDNELSSVRGSIDFLGVNIVTALYAYDYDYYTEDDSIISYYLDWQVGLTGDKDGVPIGVKIHEYAVPYSISKTVRYIQSNYNNFTMYITQTGWGIDYVNMSETLEDDSRVSFFETYYDELAQAIRDGANVKGVFAWSLIDGFEFNLGLSVRLGIHYVDYDLTRYLRKSALWHKAMLANTTSTRTSLSVARQ